ncbi:tyrosine-type recombinase/integrase [Sulfurimonas microaerophilic]|uniref:tyrosine-type recombinase/integrase n=1 Tax=Sulfurimonas microaerophilic TaxID=3058392 RepID=UPI0027148D4F|nr:tyrosine-type recombinase/integrase [Sulfurimonas sp. hsl 1-7]
MNIFSLPLPNCDLAARLINDFFNYSLIQKKSKTTHDGRTKLALSFLSVYCPKDISRNLVIQFLESVTSGSSSSSKNKQSSFMRTILKYLYSLGYENCKFELPYITTNPKIPPYISEDEMTNILNKYQRAIRTAPNIWKARRDYALLIFAYATGMRATEICRFKMSDLDKQSGFIRIENGKGSKDRYVPIAPRAIRALEELYKYMPSYLKSLSTPLFISDTLRVFDKTTLWMHFKGVFGLNPHLLRHTFATHLIQNGCDVYIVSEFLGHSDLATTQIYTHIQPQHLQETVNKNFPSINT